MDRSYLFVCAVRLGRTQQQQLNYLIYDRHWLFLFHRIQSKIVGTPMRFPLACIKQIAFESYIKFYRLKT